MESSVKREREYKRFVRENIAHVEDGLIVVSEQFKLPTGNVDMLARGPDGNDVLIELRYSSCSSSAIGQVLRYREDYRRKSKSETMRYILVAPQIPDNIKALLDHNRMEYREIPFSS